MERSSCRRGEGSPRRERQRVSDEVREHALRAPDEEGNEYTTFKEAIARQAVAAEGKRARIGYHEQQRGEFTNVYLDKVEPLEEDEAEEADKRSPEEAGWDAAVEAAPYLLGATEAKKPVEPDELFEKLKPFQERVAEDEPTS